MAYQPKNCCECGEKIQRANWSWATSRRFCELCETNFKYLDWTPKIMFIAGLFLAIVSLANFYGKPEKSLVVSNNQPSNFLSNVNQNANSSAVGDKSSAILTNSQKTNGVASVEQKPQNPSAAKPLEKIKPAENKSNAAPETAVYFCGAQTKKGTPCTRRVRGGGRCFQHVGQPAMLSADKLIAN